MSARMASLSMRQSRNAAILHLPSLCTPRKRRAAAKSADRLHRRKFRASVSPSISPNACSRGRSWWRCEFSSLVLRPRPARRRGQGTGAQDRARRRALRHGPALPQPRPQQLDPQPRVRAPDRARREAAPHARPRRELEGDRRHGVGVQAAQGRHLARRQPVHGRRRGVHLRARAQGAQQPLELRRRRQGQDRQEDRRPHRAHLRGLRGADAAQRALEPDDRVEEARRGRRHPGLQLRQGRDRHRPLQARQVHAGRPHRVRPQRCLLGPEVQVGEADVQADPGGAGARRRPARGRSST